MRAGHQWIDRNYASASRPDDGSFGAPDYAVISVALSREIAFGVIGAVTFSTTNLSRSDCFGGQKICGTPFVATLSRPS